MPPLIKNMNNPLELNKVRMTPLDDPQINAANAGGGECYVATGLPWGKLSTTNCEES
jgi:hypothetical protein